MRVRNILGVLFLIWFGANLGRKSAILNGITNDDKSHEIVITFQRIGPRNPRFRTEASEGVWLRLKNNTSRPIFLYANLDNRSATERELLQGFKIGFVNDGAEVDACYDVDGVPTWTTTEKKDKDGRLRVNVDVPYRVKAPEESLAIGCGWMNSGHIASRTPWLWPGESAVFSVPRNFLDRGLRISTRFSYDWEADANGYIKHGEPEHRVFYGYDQLAADRRKSD